MASRQPRARPRASALTRWPPSSSARASPPPTGENARASIQVGGACQTRIVGSTAQARSPAIAARSSASRGADVAGPSACVNAQDAPPASSGHRQRVERRAAIGAQQHRGGAQGQSQQEERCAAPRNGGARVADRRRSRRRRHGFRLAIGLAPAGLDAGPGSLKRPALTAGRALPVQVGYQNRRNRAKANLADCASGSAHCARSAVAGRVSRPRPRAGPPAPASAPRAPPPCPARWRARSPARANAPGSRP